LLKHPLMRFSKALFLSPLFWYVCFLSLLMSLPYLLFLLGRDKRLKGTK
jgi:hypothetical protein